MWKDSQKTARPAALVNKGFALQCGLEPDRSAGGDSGPAMPRPPTHAPPTARCRSLTWERIAAPIFLFLLNGKEWLRRFT